MGIVSGVQSAISSVKDAASGTKIGQNLGFIPKAILEFEDCRETMKKINRNPAIVRGNPMDFAVDGIPPVPESLTETMLGTVGLTTDIIGYHKAREGTKYLRYEVLFNPKEITVSGRGSAMVPMIDKEKGGQVTYQPRPGQIELRIPLIVDRTLSSKISMGVPIPGVNTSLSGGAMALWDAVFEENSIQQEVEVFIGLLQSTYTRRVVFYWGDMVYDGFLSSANANYEIFDPNGNPTRATIDLFMILESADFPTLLFDGKREGPWMKYYQKTFGDESFVSGVKGSQWGSNLLNL